MFQSVLQITLQHQSKKAVRVVFPGHVISCIEMPLHPLARRTSVYVIYFYGLLEIKGPHEQTPDHPGVEVIFQNKTTSTPLIMLEQNVKVRVQECVVRAGRHFHCTQCFTIHFYPIFSTFKIWQLFQNHPVYVQHPVKPEQIVEMLTFSMFVPNKLTGFRSDYREFTVCTNINISIQQNRCKQ